MTHTLSDYVSPITAASLIALWTAYLGLTSRRRPEFPGPNGYPIIGNVLDFPSSPEWKGLLRLARNHDTDILYMNVFGADVLTVSSVEAAIDLFEKKSSTYADRPRAPMIKELMGVDWCLPLMPYGEATRVHHRRLFHQCLNTKKADKLENFQYTAVHEFLYRLVENPQGFFGHVNFLTGSLMLMIMYGIKSKSETDTHFLAAQRAAAAVSRAMIPGAFLVDIFPTLKLVPGWFPGAGFHKFAKDCKKDLEDSINLPFERVKGSMHEPATASSIVGNALENMPEYIKKGIDEGVLQGAAATAWFAGTDTTSSSIHCFFAMMLLHPEVAAKGQEELDRVVGRERLPELSDRENLPYVEAILKEVMRWQPALPLGVARQTLRDDVYRGKFIPSGTTVLINAWAMCHDEKLYPNPEVFDPSRFLLTGKLNPEVFAPENIVFGFGRRSCPGKRFALRELFLTLACTLAAFDIRKAVGKNGEIIEPELGHEMGVLCQWRPFECSITPRSISVRELVTRARDSHIQEEEIDHMHVA